MVELLRLCRWGKSNHDVSSMPTMAPIPLIALQSYHMIMFCLTIPTSPVVRMWATGLKLLEEADHCSRGKSSFWKRQCLKVIKVHCKGVGRAWHSTHPNQLCNNVPHSNSLQRERRITVVPLLTIPPFQTYLPPSSLWWS